MRNKTEFYSVFAAFQALVENQLNTKIKIFQSDGGGEFMSKQFKEHLTRDGISQRISCPYTPEQNGIAERKHRYIMELGLSMMFDSHLPLHHWVEAFFAASYITNLLPSNQGEKKSSVEMLRKQKPNYSHLRVLGSACFPYLRPVADHKMEPRSLQCVFLGYSPQFKGYRCLYPPTGKVYISRHVIFDEEYFPFKEAYKNLVPRYETTLLKAWQKATLQSQESGPEQITKILQPPPIPPPVAEVVPQQLNQPQPAPPPIVDQVPPIPQAAEEAPVGNTHNMRTRGKSGIQKPNSRYVMLTS